MTVPMEYGVSVGVFNSRRPSKVSIALETDTWFWNRHNGNGLIKFSEWLLYWMGTLVIKDYVIKTNL